MLDPSMWPTKTYLLILSFVGACALSMVYPIVGIANYMMVYQCNPHWWWWGKPLAPFGIRYSMTAFICLFVGMLVSSSRVPRTRHIFGDWMILLILFTLIIVTSTIVAGSSSSYSVSLIDKTVKMTVFLYCFVRMGAERRNFRIILWTLVIGTLMIGNDAFHANADQFANGRLNSVGGGGFSRVVGIGGAHGGHAAPARRAVALRPRMVEKTHRLAAAILAVNTIVQCRRDPRLSD
jgi:hypothetical protein